MPRKGRPKTAQPQSAPSESAERQLPSGDQTIERAIDAIDWLRTEMRRSGMTLCADALDEAFAKCLQDYVTRNQETMPDGPSLSGKKLN